MKSKPPRQTPAEKLAARRDSNRDTIEQLKNLAKHPDINGNEFLELCGLIERMGICNRPENNWWSADLESADGRRYGGIGSLWRCNSRLCSNCLAIHSMRNRKTVRRAVAAQQPKRGERFQFITFTIPKTSLPLVVIREIVNRAWRTFSRRSLCRSLIRGGAKSEEFTVSPSGFHYHLHVFALTKWLLYTELRRAWTDAVRDAFRDAGHAIDFKTSDGLAVVNVRRVDNIDHAILELCKYITKSDSWKRLDRESLRTAPAFVAGIACLKCSAPFGSMMPTLRLPLRQTLFLIHVP